MSDDAGHIHDQPHDHDHEHNGVVHSHQHTGHDHVHMTHDGKFHTEPDDLDDFDFPDGMDRNAGKDC